MANCPACKTPGAYVGFNSVECRNPRCIHFTIEEEDICPCCGKKGHTPSAEFLKKRQTSFDPNAPIEFDPNQRTEG